jgi:hypothetical protein
MSKSAVSVYVFSFYLFVLGALLVVIPNALMSPFGIARTDEVWIRVVGTLVLILGYYYNHAARQGFTSFFRCTAYARFSVLLFFIAFVLLGFAPPALILFGVIDAVAALWTGLALRSERAA